MNPVLFSKTTSILGFGRRFVPQDETLEPKIIAAKNSTSAKTPWWSWPHLLGLDASLVALVWQRWWAHATGVTLPLSREVILGLGVWLIYLADRLADTSGENHRKDEPLRHRFARDHREILRPLVLLIAVVLVIVTPYCLPIAEFGAGLGLLSMTIGYFWLIHGRQATRWAAYFPKEALVGALFGTGSAFFVVFRISPEPVSLWIGTGLFSGVCFLNCALITRWERRRNSPEPFSLLNALPRFSACLGLICVVVAVAALLASGLTFTSHVTPVAMSALLLAGLDYCENRLSPDALRVLADVVLLTPLLGMT